MRERTAVLQLRPEGLYCPAGDFYVDPWRPVPCAVITHGHADHARPGHGHYHGSIPGAGILRRRLGEALPYTGHAYREPFTLGAATVSFHPAGHVLGSAQVRIEVDGEVWVAAGDYKRADDPSCEPFELVPCDGFVTEATFALPIYRWDDDARVLDDLLAWWDGNVRAGRTSVVGCYALGKAQRLLALLAQRTDRPVHLHGALLAMVEAYREAGIHLAPTVPIGELARNERLPGELVLAPPSALAGAWLRRFADPSTAFASGWMRVRGQRRRRGYDRGFVISDHADWHDLIRTIDGTGARHVVCAHGQTEALARFLREERGLDAVALQTLDEGEGDDG